MLSLISQDVRAPDDFVFPMADVVSTGERWLCGREQASKTLVRRSGIDPIRSSQSHHLAGFAAKQTFARPDFTGQFKLSAAVAHGARASLTYTICGR